MLPVIADRVLETSTSTGTGAFTLNGPPLGYRSFAVGVGVGNDCYYCIENTSTGEWEVGRGTLSGTSLITRVSVNSNSLGNTNLVAFGAGTKNVFVTVPANSEYFTPSFTFVQASAASVWTINHNLNRHPHVTVVDSAGTVVYGDIHYVDANNLTITFRAQFGGTAYM